MKKIFTLLFSCLSVFGFTQSSTVVISQVYGGGGSSSSSAAYKSDYVELHNVSNATQDISGFSLQYGSSTGQFGGSTGSNVFVFPGGTTIPAGGFLLVALGNPGTGGADLPVTADLSSTAINMALGSGKIALVNNGTPLTCGTTASLCSLPDANIVDLVAYGSANNAEGGTAVNNGTALVHPEGGVRKVSGCQDTDNNNADFDVVATPIPRNSTSTVVNCTTMPLSLVSFNASLVGQKVKIDWVATNEVNVLGYEIERSVNGKDFMPISLVHADGAGTGTKNYSFVDQRAVAGVSYYRLKMNDKDGSFKYSQIAMVKNASVGVSIYPNPVRNAVTIQHEAADKGATIAIVSLSGKQVLTVNVQAGAVQTTLEAAQLAPGAYMIVYTNNGMKQTKQFIKE